MHTIKTVLKSSIYMILLVVFCNISVADSLPGYTIITTIEIQNISEKLSDFVTHKESLGFDVQVITEADFGGGIGDEAAENIRAWLQANYIAYNIEYVLLIGDPRTDIGEIPMKMFWPGGYVPNDPNVSAPSDVYYADLTGNWDLDSDGYYGEWEEDFGTGGVDCHWEVIVGRIPYYPEIDTNDILDGILEKTIDYEEKTLSGQSLEWRKNALLGISHSVGSCLFGESIKDDILIPAEWSYHRVYHNDSMDGCEMDPSPETIITSMPCEHDTPFPEIWGDHKFGLVIWKAHGNAGGSQCIIGNYQSLLLNNDYPSFTFQVSCFTGEPESTNNLAYALLKHGAICTVAPNRESQGEHWSYKFTDSGMAYEYVSRIVAGQTSGEALYTLKERIPPPDGGFWPNYLNYNIYGDPSLRLVNLEEKIIYVDSNASGKKDGSSWENAYNYLQDALATALPGSEIRVAQGTYKPDQGIGINSGDREASFSLRNGVVLKGGYAGIGALDPNLRIIESYKTILSGDLSGNDIEVAGANDLLNELTKSENSYHVLSVAPGVSEASIIDGLTIIGGNADSNDAKDSGGGIYIDHANPKLINCNILNNYAIYGGGVYNKGGAMILKNCTFRNNYVKSSGGAIYNHGYIMLDGCTFVANKTDYDPYDGYGGAMTNYYGHSTLMNCLFSGNRGSFGGAINNQKHISVLNNCTFCKNDAYSGGSFWNWDSSSLFTNCILWENTPQEIANYDTNSITVISYNDLKTSDGIPWPGDGNIYKDPNFAKLGYWANVNDPNIVVGPKNPNAIWIDGDYHLKSQAGRWNPNSQSWVVDDVHSDCIDAGDPDSDWTEELWPHGGRINMGAYGGTAEASMSLSNIGDARDLNNDDLVTWDDVLIFTEKWLSNDVPLKEDLDLDGVVDVNDLALYNVWLADSNNTAPVIFSIEDQYVFVGSELSFAVSAIDDDGDALTYLALGLPDGALFDEQLFIWTPQESGTYLITFIISDYKSLDYLTVQIIVDDQ